jgi:hypothetical protein
MKRKSKIAGNTPPRIKAYNLARVKLARNHPDDWKKLLSNAKIYAPNKTSNQQRSLVIRALITKYQNEYDTILKNALVVFGVEVSEEIKAKRARQQAELEQLEMIQNKSNDEIITELLLERTSK